MSHRVWTKQGKVAIAVVVVITIALLSLGGCEVISYLIKEIRIASMEVPNND